MTKSKGMQLGALFAAMLILTMVFMPVVSVKTDLQKYLKIVDIIFHGGN